MNKVQHNGYVRGPASETEALRSGTYIITDEWSSTQEKVGLLDEVFIAASIVLQPARALADDEDDDESGMDIQVIDLEEDDDDEDAFEEDEEADGEEDEEAGTAFHFVTPVAAADDEDEFEEAIEEEFNDDGEGGGAYSSVSPALTSGDVDADWKRAEITGEETSGGSVATPDQDVVDLIGRAAGVVYADDEPLDFAEKIGQRDRNRWELDPASVDPDMRELSEEPAPPEPQQAGLKSKTRS